MTGPVSNLPEVVDLLPGAKNYRADSRLSVRQLAMDLLDVPIANHPAISATLMDRGIMAPTQLMVKFALWIVRKRGLRDYDFWMDYYKRQPKEATNTIEQTVTHIVEGQDREEASSVGGFSQREVNTLANVIALTSGAYTATMEDIAQHNEVH